MSSTTATVSLFARAKELAQQRSLEEQKRHDQLIAAENQRRQRLIVDIETTRTETLVRLNNVLAASNVDRHKPVIMPELVAAPTQSALERDVEQFIENFSIVVSNWVITHPKWKPGAIDLVESYVLALVSHDDVHLPKIDLAMSKFINDRFVYGMVLYAKRSRPLKNIPDDYFVGQRQEWYGELFAEKSR